MAKWCLHKSCLFYLPPPTLPYNFHSENQPWRRDGKRLQEVWEQLRCESFSCNSLEGKTIRIWQHWIGPQSFPIIFIYLLLLFTYTIYLIKCSPSLTTFLTTLWDCQSSFLTTPPPQQNIIFSFTLFHEPQLPPLFFLLLLSHILLCSDSFTSLRKNLRQQSEAVNLI